jgi:Flp pilus assembly protein TadG
LYRSDRGVSSEHGSAAVELALVLLPLMMLLLGIVEFSRAWSMQLRLQAAAREAAREVALSYDDPGVTDVGPLAIARLDSLLGAGVVADLDTVTIVECSVASPVPDAVVTLRDELNLAIPLADGTTLGSVTVGGRSQMPCEG